MASEVYYKSILDEVSKTMLKTHGENGKYGTPVPSSEALRSDPDSLSGYVRQLGQRTWDAANGAVYATDTTDVPIEDQIKAWQELRTLLDSFTRHAITELEMYR
ncbi:hypothetical protein [Tsukamurella pseudospumae]|uniref:Uncharacterized protein n=1 Tax=Tsukamurella pseudospumae TaxID=239498 RepID=A0A138A8L9_9ACTN|nr:hypothetical protein [Tsukamurella pseudospumae]KXP06744.1 hypothetical protein AXK60_11815 [Tsukamurella pseudospumae]